MNTTRKFKYVAEIVMVVTLTLLVVMASPAVAAGNDNFADATLIDQFPYSDSSNTAGATIDPNDPVTCVGQLKSIWYTYTADSNATMTVSASTDNGYNVTLAIFLLENGGLTQVNGCQDGGQVSSVIEVQPGQTYYIELMARYTAQSYPYPDPPADPDGGNVTLNINTNFPPENDNFDAATVVSELPFATSVDTTYATIESGEPAPNCYWNFQRTIWYAFTPATDGIFTIDSSGGYYTVLAVYTGSELNNLQSVACAAGWAGTQIVLDGEAGITYYIQTHYSDWGEIISVNINQVFPPDNNDFINAEQVTGVPFSDSADAIYATTEIGEPTTCGWNFHKTIWYSFTPATSGSYTAEANGGGYPTVAVYEGTDFTNLVQLACSTDWTARTTLAMEAGKTYYFQAHINDEWYNSWIYFNLYSTPPPEAYFSYWPGDPSKFDSVQFNNESYDPYGSGIATCLWDFGDGSTSTDCYPLHQFMADGDYTVQLTATTFDGRSASTTQMVAVRTRDVGITRFVVPTSARAGQTKQVNVYIKNSFYPETVQVDLYKSTPNGYEWVGSLTQYVPVRPANRAQIFSFNYTFTSQDADIGKVTFKAIASVINGRDAFPADNEVISLATKVAR